MVGFVNINPLPVTEGLGAFMVHQMPRRVLEGNKVPYGPMVIQRIYPFIQFDRHDSNVGPVMDMQELTPSPVNPMLQNIGPIMAGPITVPEGAYADAEQEAVAPKEEGPIPGYFIVGGLFILAALLYQRSRRRR